MLNEYDGIDPPVWGQDLSGMNGATYPTIGGPEVIEVVSGIYSNEWKPNDEGIIHWYIIRFLYQLPCVTADKRFCLITILVRIVKSDAIYRIIAVLFRGVGIRVAEFLPPIHPILPLPRIQQVSYLAVVEGSGGLRWEFWYDPILLLHGNG